MKKLIDILSAVSIQQCVGEKEQVIQSLSFDSRAVEEGTLFFAIKGTMVDGHQFIEKAIEQGAVAVVCEELPVNLKEGVTYLQVDNSQKAMAYIAHEYYGKPSEQLKLVGVTGTNGKTTVATLLHQLFTNLGYSCGLLSTVKIVVGNEEFPTSHTTPDAIKINQYLRRMVDTGCTHAFMEVSSHGVAQSRTKGLFFSGGIFTNLSHDHLDYHKDFADYRDTKKIFFDELPKSAFAISNVDDKNGQYMLQNSEAKTRYYGVRNMADIHIRIVEKQLNGMMLLINQKEVWVQLIGAFNAANIAAVYGATLELGVSEEQALVQLSLLRSVAGRFQSFEADGKIGVVDYAHTPDALQNVLETLNDLKKNTTKIYTVVGCGGDRDKTKRSQMAKIAIENSDFVVLTSDNPRTENPDTILDDMEVGIEEKFEKQYIRIADRAQAIKMACQMAQRGDLILVAGKGHETYQEINGVRNHFDDCEEIKKNL